MKLQILSDPHFDARPLAHPFTASPEADVVLVAGDVCQGLEQGFAWLRRTIPTTPIITVAGNHSYYQRCLPDELAHARRVAADYGISFLENDVVTIGGLTFAGATLWTDYRLYGEAAQAHAMASARSSMNDHRRISWCKDPWRRFRPQEALELHRESVAFLESTPADVVITHHAPSERSVHPKYAGDLVNAAYASNLEHLMRSKLWVHGHVHSSFDYQVGDTRVICNPHGYGAENPDFNPELIVEIN